MKQAKKQPTDRDRLRIIGGKLNRAGSYSEVIGGVNTWNIVDIFEDFREVLNIARKLEPKTRPQP